MTAQPRSELEAENRELRAEVTSLTRSLGVRADRLDKIDALLPDCPTCGGKQMILRNGDNTRWGADARPWIPCPDCPDTPGKVSVAQLAVRWRAIDEFLAYSVKARSDPESLRHLLQAVKP